MTTALRWATAVTTTALVVFAAAAWACNPQAHVQLDSATYEAGSVVTIHGSYFPANATITLSMSSGATTTVQTSAGGGFTTQLTAPLQPGNYSLAATRPTGGFAVASFTVVAAQPPVVTPPPPPPPPDLTPALLGPVILRAQSADRTVRVSRKGVVVLLCGRVEQFGVTGTCGAASRAVTAAGPKLALRPKAFRVERGEQIRVVFHLTRTRLRQVKAAGRLRMRGTVVARGALGNSSSRAVGFTRAGPRKGAPRR